MAWDDQGNGKSPWDPNKGQPPDLDQIVEEWQKRFNRLFGMKTSGSGKRRKKTACPAYRVDDSFYMGTFRTVSN